MAGKSEDVEAGWSLADTEVAIVAMPAAIPAVWCRKSRRLELDPMASARRSDGEVSMRDPFLVGQKTGMASAYRSPSRKSQPGHLKSVSRDYLTGSSNGCLASSP